MLDRAFDLLEEMNVVLGYHSDRIRVYQDSTYLTKESMEGFIERMQAIHNDLLSYTEATASQLESLGLDLNALGKHLDTYEGKQ